MIITKILSALGKILVGDFAGCFNKFRKEEEIEELLSTKLSGTLGLLHTIQKEVLKIRESSSNANLIDDNWLLLRKGKIQWLCHSPDNEVKTQSWNNLAYLGLAVEVLLPQPPVCILS